MYYIYLLRCAGNRLYTGITTDPARRLRQHQGAVPGGAKFTASHPPERMEMLWCTPERGDALRVEARIKRLKRTEKEQLLREPTRLHSLCALPGELPCLPCPEQLPEVSGGGTESK